jgi:hypothetical protein
VGQVSDSEQLQQLHDAYVWEVNAAVGEDRMDLVWQLADDYLEQALRLITTGAGPACGRSDCVVCSEHRSMPPESRHRWLVRLRLRRAA